MMANRSGWRMYVRTSRGTHNTGEAPRAQLDASKGREQWVAVIANYNKRLCRSASVMTWTLKPKVRVERHESRQSQNGLSLPFPSSRALEAFSNALSARSAQPLPSVSLLHSRPPSCSLLPCRATRTVYPRTLHLQTRPRSLRRHRSQEHGASPRACSRSSPLPRSSSSGRRSR